MAVYVDILRGWGWKLGPSCHLITDGELDELHVFAASIGMKRSWFQTKSIPHYDLTTKRRQAAVAKGAVELDDRRFVVLVRQIRQKMRGQ